MLQVIGTPYKAKRFNSRGDRAHVSWRIPTDRGDLTTDQAAELLEVSRGAIVHRLRAVQEGILPVGDLLRPAMDVKLRRPKARKKEEDPAELQCSIPKEEWGKYARLSTRSRGERLERIRVGRWEAQRGER